MAPPAQLGPPGCVSDSSEGMSSVEVEELAVPQWGPRQQLHSDQPHFLLFYLNSSGHVYVSELS